MNLEDACWAGTPTVGPLCPLGPGFPPSPWERNRKQSFGWHPIWIPRTVGSCEAPRVSGSALSNMLLNTDRCIWKWNKYCDRGSKRLPNGTWQLGPPISCQGALAPTTCLLERACLINKRRQSPTKSPFSMSARPQSTPQLHGSSEHGVTTRPSNSPNPSLVVDFLGCRDQQQWLWYFWGP